MPPPAILTNLYSSATMRHALAVLVIFLVVFAGAEPLVRDFAFEKAHDWIGPEEAILGIAPKIGIESAPQSASTLLTEQAIEAQRGALMHLKITEFFFVRYYISISMAAFMGLLTAITFAFISRLGWAAANPFLVSAFITLSAMTAYFAAQPSLYQQPENIDSNKHLYASYRAILNDIKRFAAVPQAPPAQTADAFCKEIDKRLADLRSLPVSFNPSAVGELQRTLQQAASEDRNSSHVDKK